MKPRVPLYGCFPRGLGTPFVESLTGFVGRLAVARHLPSSAIFEHLVRPLVPEGVVRENLHLTSFLSSGAVTYDGLNPSAEALVGALTRLTGLRDLSFLTLLPWRGFLSKNSGALRWRRPKRWCCRCLAEWRRRGTEFWEPLLWRVSVVQRCPVHRVPFTELCPRCRARQGVVSEIVPFGYCRKCGHELEADDPLCRDMSAGEPRGPEALWEWWTSVAVGRMLASQRLLDRSGSPYGFSALLRWAVGGSVKQSAEFLARYLDIGRNSIEVWMKRERCPRLDFFLAACMRLGTDPLKVAVELSPVPVPHDPLPWFGARPPWPSLRRHRQRRYRRDPEHFRRLGAELRRLLNDPDARYLSITAVAQRLQTTRHTLITRFPDEYAQVVARHDASRAEWREVVFARRSRALWAAVSACVSQGKYPSKRRVFEAAGLSSTFQRVPRYVQVWREALREHGVQPA